MQNQSLFKCVYGIFVLQKVSTMREFGYSI